MSTFVDLTVPIETGHWRYPNFIRPAQTLAGGDSRNVRYMDLRSHWFTHIDAPRHIKDDGKTLEEFDLFNLLIGRASIIDVSDCTANEPLGEERLKKGFEGCETTDFLIVKTSWGQQRDWHTEEYWLDAPYITEEGAYYLKSLNPKVVAFDFPQDHDTRLRNVPDRRVLAKPTHDILLGTDVLMIEYINYLWKVPVQNVDVFALPLKVTDADGAQIRIAVRF
jgi:arylformamidase